MHHGECVEAAAAGEDHPPSAMMDLSLLAACTLLRLDHTVAHLVTLVLQIYMFKMQNVFEESQCKFIR